VSVSCSQACVTWRWLAPREFDAVDARDPDIDLLLIATAVDGDGLAAAVLREADRACERHGPHLRALERAAAPYLALGVVLEAEDVVVVECPPQRAVLHASHGPAVLQRACVLSFRRGGGRVVDEVDAVLDGESHSSCHSATSKKRPPPMSSRATDSIWSHSGRLLHAMTVALRR